MAEELQGPSTVRTEAQQGLDAREGDPSATMGSGRGRRRHYQRDVRRLTGEDGTWAHRGRWSLAVMGGDGAWWRGEEGRAAIPGTRGLPEVIVEVLAMAWRGCFEDGGLCSEVQVEEKEVER